MQKLKKLSRKIFGDGDLPSRDKRCESANTMNQPHVVTIRNPPNHHENPVIIYELHETSK